MSRLRLIFHVKIMWRCYFLWDCRFFLKNDRAVSVENWIILHWITFEIIASNCLHGNNVFYEYSQLGRSTTAQPVEIPRSKRRRMKNRCTDREVTVAAAVRAELRQILRAATNLRKSTAAVGRKVRAPERKTISTMIICSTEWITKTRILWSVNFLQILLLSLGAAGKIECSFQRWETCVAAGRRVKLPQDLCEHSEIFHELLEYPKIWEECLNEEQRESLLQFLPKFPDDCNVQAEMNETLRMLFQRENQR